MVQWICDLPATKTVPGSITSGTEICNFQHQKRPILTSNLSTATQKLFKYLRILRQEPTIKPLTWNIKSYRNHESITTSSLKVEKVVKEAVIATTLKALFVMFYFQGFAPSQQNPPSVLINTF